MTLANPSLPTLLSRPANSEQTLRTVCDIDDIRGLLFPPSSRVSGPVLAASGLVSPTTLGTPNMSRENSWQANDLAEIQKMLCVQNAELMSLIRVSLDRQEEAIMNLLKTHSEMKYVSTENAMSVPVKIKDSADVINKKYSQSSRGVDLLTIGPEEIDEANSVVAAENQKTSIRKVSFSSKIESLAWSWRRTYECAPQHSKSDLKAIWNELEGSSFRNRRSLFDMILTSHAYDAAMFAVIVLNCVLIIAETDADVGCNAKTGCTPPSWIWYVNLILLLIYTIESFIVLDTYRSAVLKKRSRLLELFIVLAGYLDFFLANISGNAPANVQLVKLIRVTRILRGARLISVCPELKRMMQGLSGAMRAMLWGFGLLMLFIVTTSIVAVEVLYDLNQTLNQDAGYCEEIFDSVWNSTILFFQIVIAGDSWGSCTLTLMKSYPSMFILFGGVLVATQVGFLNLVMSVILDQVAEAREKDKEKRLQKVDAEIRSSRQKWLELFETLDLDGDGQLSLEELIAGFESLPNFSQDWKLLGIEKGDLPRILELMDEDGSGQVSANELVFIFDMLWHFDQKMISVITSMSLSKCFARLDKRLTRMENLIVS